MASITFDTGMEELGAYVASKGALIGLTRVWARELVLTRDGQRRRPRRVPHDAEKYIPIPRDTAASSCPARR
ncbi:hypothetical protein F2981_00695 [Sinorhizobium meliloti]|nr:hypothetical protein [Sinorhizobium meliloti]